MIIQTALARELALSVHQRNPAFVRLICVLVAGPVTLLAFLPVLIQAGRM